MLDIQPDNNGIYVEGNKGWFISRKFNYLYEIDIIANKCTFLAELPESGYEYARYHTLCYKYDDNILCLPDRSNKIWIYSLLSGEFSSILMPGGRTERWCIRKIHRHNDSLFLFSLFGNCVCEVGLSEKKINQRFQFPLEANETVGACVFEETLAYVVVNAENPYVYIFDLNNFVGEKQLLSIQGKRFNTICKRDSKLFLTGSLKEIVVWDLDRKTYQVLDMFPEGFGYINFLFLCPFAKEPTRKVFEQEGEFLFCDSFVLNDKVWFVPLRTNGLLYLDNETDEIKEVLFENEVETMESIQRAGMIMYKYFLEFVEDISSFRVYSFMTSKHYVVDTISARSRICAPNYSLTNVRVVIQKYLQSRDVFHEGFFLDNEMFVAAMDSNDHNVKEAGIGKKVYNYLHI